MTLPPDYDLLRVGAGAVASVGTGVVTIGCGADVGDAEGGTGADVGAAGGSASAQEQAPIPAVTSRH